MLICPDCNRAYDPQDWGTDGEHVICPDCDGVFDFEDLGEEPDVRVISEKEFDLS